jgi:hypothetical protein
MLTEDKHHQVAEAQKTWDCFRLVTEARRLGLGMQRCHMSILFLQPRLMSSSFAGWCGDLLGRFDNSVGLSQGASEGMSNISARSGS